MDKLDIYLRSSRCSLIECLYGDDMSCEYCIKCMIAEHDAKVIDAFVREVESNWLFRGESSKSYRGTIEAISKRMKE